MGKEKPINTDEIVWRGKRFLLEFFDSCNYPPLNEIAQVYGFIFNDKGELLIVKCEDDRWTLPGGGPEPEDKTWRETLKREADEEADVDLMNIKPAGYLKSTCLEKDSPEVTFAIRAAAEIVKIKPQTIDPAHGGMNERKFIPVGDFFKYMKWGENGKVQLNLALKALGKA